MRSEALSKNGERSVRGAGGLVSFRLLQKRRATFQLNATRGKTRQKVSLINSKEVRVRFAPSPTGYLHVGGARTALYNWLFARKLGGKMILRIEDTDTRRSTRASEEAILEDLRWMGLDWDEGPDVGGPHGPYRQSERATLYREMAERLVERGRAYRCFCSAEEIDKMKKEAEKLGVAPIYRGRWARASRREVNLELSRGTPFCYRFRVPKNERVLVPDLVRGPVSWGTESLGDFVLVRSNGMPVYNFCVAVDDALMRITHVLRADEHLANTLRQALIYEALELRAPQFAHISLIMAPDRTKLSKRHGATSVGDFRRQGFLPSALTNYLCLLGWNDGTNREIFLPPLDPDSAAAAASRSSRAEYRGATDKSENGSGDGKNDGRGNIAKKDTAAARKKEAKEQKKAVKRQQTANGSGGGNGNGNDNGVILFQGNGASTGGVELNGSGKSGNGAVRISSYHANNGNGNGNGNGKGYASGSNGNGNGLGATQQNVVVTSSSLLLTPGKRRMPTSSSPPLPPSSSSSAPFSNGQVLKRSTYQSSAGQRTNGMFATRSFDDDELDLELKLGEDDDEFLKYLDTLSSCTAADDGSNVLESYLDDVDNDDDEDHVSWSVGATGASVAVDDYDEEEDEDEDVGDDFVSSDHSLSLDHVGDADADDVRVDKDVGSSRNPGLRRKGDRRAGRQGHKSRSGSGSELFGGAAKRQEDYLGLVVPAATGVRVSGVTGCPFLDARPAPATAQPRDEEQALCQYVLQDLSRAFSMTRVVKRSAIFDKDKLCWMNGKHFKRLSDRRVAERLVASLVRKGILLEPPEQRESSASARTAATPANSSALPRLSVPPSSSGGKEQMANAPSSAVAGLPNLPPISKTVFAVSTKPLPAAVFPGLFPPVAQVASWHSSLVAAAASGECPYRPLFSTPWLKPLVEKLIAEKPLAVPPAAPPSVAIPTSAAPATASSSSSSRDRGLKSHSISVVASDVLGGQRRGEFDPSTIVASERALAGSTTVTESTNILGVSSSATVGATPPGILDLDESDDEQSDSDVVDPDAGASGLQETAAWVEEDALRFQLLDQSGGHRAIVQATLDAFRKDVHFAEQLGDVLLHALRYPLRAALAAAEVPAGREEQPRASEGLAVVAAAGAGAGEEEERREREVTRGNDVTVIVASKGEVTTTVSRGGKGTSNKRNGRKSESSPPRTSSLSSPAPPSSSNNSTAQAAADSSSPASASQGSSSFSVAAEIRALLQDGFADVVRDLLEAHRSGKFRREAVEGGYDGCMKWIKNYGEATGRSSRRLFLPLRLALTGAVRGPALARVLQLLRVADENKLVIGPLVEHVTLSQRFEYLEAWLGRYEAGAGIAAEILPAVSARN